MDEHLIDACQMFLVPMTILFAAIALASTEPLKALISVLGAVVSGTWYYAISNWPKLTDIDSKVGRTLAGAFLLAWTISAIAHAWRCLWPAESQQQTPVRTGRQSRRRTS